MTDIGHKKQIQEFVKVWTGRGYEKGESQKFWLELLEILGISNPFQYITFEDQVHIDHTSFIDGYIPKTHVLIEQKSLGKDLRASIKQSDGTFLTPFQQAKRYSAELPYSERPRWIVTCNFSEFLVYDMERPSGEPESIMLKDLEKEVYRLQFLVSEQDAALQREMELSLQAGELVGRLYDALLQQYIDPTSAETLKSLNVLCVRLVFCLYAEDAGLFGEHNAFRSYLSCLKIGDVREALIALFKVLDTRIEDRNQYTKPELLNFPYVNGGLFSDESIEIPRFTKGIINLLVNDCSADFDWSGISPTIFGAVFESTLNPETRRSGGMHYTSIENIHKVIDPLFFDDLMAEIGEIEAIMPERKRKERLMAFQDKIANLKFFDPACGSGNFLTETFMSLRRLENRVLNDLIGERGERYIGGEFTPIKVNINQFYGIEINDFAVTVAKVALWIAESQMMQETEDIVGRDIDFLPLKSYANILEGNALRMNWNMFPEDTGSKAVIYANSTNVVSIGEEHTGDPSGDGNLKDPIIHYGDIDLHTRTLSINANPVRRIHRVTFDYIISNPPFVGARLMNESQKDDMLHVFGKKWKNVGNMDYVCGWYRKASEIMSGEKTRAAFVSTNSISQGEQVANLWKPLIENGVHIDFAYRTFRWDSESEFKVHVHCVVIGFSSAPSDKPKVIFDGEEKIHARNISPYLIDAENIIIESKPTTICAVPEIGIGNKPIDDGNYLFTQEEMEIFIAAEPKSAEYFKPFYGSREFINKSPRYCLWLGDCTPAQLRAMPHCIERARNVQKFRLQSKSAGTRKLAERPTRFHVENMPDSEYIAIPETSSKNRRYIPMGFLSPTVICSDAIRLIPRASLYHFGVLTSSVHMAWMRVVCGRLKSDYRYSKGIVYNNFPWPAEVGSKEETAYGSAHLDSELKARIEKTAQAILDARALYPDSSLADLYDEVTMPKELRRAHRDNDLAVMAAYGFPQDTSEAEIVAKLMGLYKSLSDLNDKNQ